MTVRTLIRLLIGASLFAQAVAGPGEDFANNLFSDLGPLLALFGERVTTQFLSQATGWADNIILAMAPLGIITIIVSAIRVSGPPILKAIIGRARESHAVVEAELMSSTSGEVCELWSSQQIVRVMGKGPIREFIILFPEESSSKDQQRSGASQAGSVGQRGLRVMDLEQDSDEYFDIEPKPEKSDADDDKSLRKQAVHDSTPETTGESIHTTQGDGYITVDIEGGQATNSNPPPFTQSRPDMQSEPSTQSQEDSLPNDQAILIFRNTSTHTPNLTLNVGKHFHHSTLQGLAAVGVILQLGVIIYFGSVTYFPTLRWRKDGDHVEKYAFPCTTVGTILLTTGILFCGHMVEKSTDETKYRPKGRACQLIWLQKSGTVNDQTFSSFAITPAKRQEVIITSSRSKAWQAEKFNQRSGGTPDTHDQSSNEGPNESPKPNQTDNPLLFLGRTDHEITTSIATFLAVSGFVLQFVGLRGMHWSASVGQLIATFIMTIIRVSIRKNLAVFPKSFSLHPEHELDWLALTLSSKDDDEPYLMSSSSTSEQKTKNGHDVSWQKNTQICDWMDALCVNEKLLSSTEDHKLRSITTGDGIDCQKPTSSTHKVVQLRRHLGKLADWPGVASQEAVFTARAIEITLDELSEAIEPDLKQATRKFSWRMRIGSDWIDFHVGQSGRNWKALADEIDAVLSLWIYHIKCTKSPNGAAPEPSTMEQDDSWLRTKGETPKRSLRLLGSSSKRLEQDLRWWAPDQELLSVIRVETMINAADAPSNDFKYAIGCCELTPGAQRPTFVFNRASTQKTADLAVETYDSLQTLLAQHIFSHFLFSLANTMSIPVPEQATMKLIDPSIEADSSRWDEFSVHHGTISRLAQKIQAVGFGSLESVYLSLIPPLSAANKLPEVDTVVQWTQKRGAIYEQRGDWTKAAEAYRRLVATARCFPERRILNNKATALFLAFRSHVRWLFETEKGRLVEQLLDGQNLEGLLTELDNKWEREKPAGTPTSLHHLLGLFFDVRKLILREPVELPEHLMSFLCFGASHQEVVQRGVLYRVAAKERNDIDYHDILGLTPLHYAMMYASNFTVKDLAASGAEMNPTDIRGRTPLHYLCRSSHPDSEMMKQMLELGARIDVQDVDGVAPLHLAALHDLESHARLLLEAGANFNLADKTGYSPLLWAALGGATGVAQELLERMGQEGLAEKLESIRDNHGRTVLHVAAMADQASFIERLTSLCGLSTLMQAKDNLDNTAIHLAAQAGKENAVKQLLRLGSETRVQNQSKKTPVHLAAENKFTEIVRILFDTDDADGLLEDRGGQTPLHLAVLTGHKETVELLLSLESDALRIYDTSDMRPLHYAAREGFNDIIDLLFEDQDTKTYDNEVTLLHLAAQYGHIDTVKLLVAKGVPVNWIDYHDQTPLDLAIEEGHEEIVQFLLSQPDVRLEDKRGNTLLHSAAMKGHIEISRLIFDIKKEEIDVNSANVDGQTPIHLATEKGHSDMIDFLIEVCKCDKTRRNNDGYGPLDIAESTGSQNVVDFLVNKFSVERHVGDEGSEEDEEDAP